MITEGRYKATIFVGSNWMEVIEEDDIESFEAAVEEALDFYRTRYKTSDVKAKY